MALLERVSEFYFRPRAFELDGRPYEWMGVVSFKKLLVRLAKTDVRNEEHQRPYLLPNRSLEGIRAFERRTRRNELIHLAAMLPSAVGLLLGGVRISALTVLLVFVLITNFHPFILQRYNRIRMREVLARRSELGRPGTQGGTGA